MKEQDLYWLAGLLEGEGSFMAGPPSSPNQPRVAVQMTDRDVIARVANLFGVVYFQARQDSRNPAWKVYFGVCLKGRPAVDLMTLLRPLMGGRRQCQIDLALASFENRAPKKLDDDKVRELRRRIGEPIARLAREFKVSRPTVRDIQNGVTWKHVR